MKKKLILLVLLTFTFTSLFAFGNFNTQKASAAPSFQVTGIVSATVTAAQLNVRHGPAVSYPIVCVLTKGQSVTVFGKINDWYAVYVPATGCVGLVLGKYLNIAWPAPKTPAPPAITPAPPAITPAPPVVTPAPSIAPKPSTGPVTPPAGVSADEQQILNLVNKARADAGVGPLQIDPALQKVARLKAQDMVDKRYFSHQSPTYGSPFDMMRQFGVTFKTAGENIAGNSSVEGAFNSWMNSPGHRQNILNGNYNYTGIGIVNSPTYGKIFVQQFIGK